MIDVPLIWEWLSFAARWLHVITAMAWIGTSFYFIALDLGLRKPHEPAPGIGGEQWQVHGGGFYHIQKYTLAPAGLPQHLIWFKWESYATWASGFALLCIIYYAGADLYLIDQTVWALPPATAIALSLASLGLGWLVYDQLCKSPIGRSTSGLMLILFALLMVMAWGYAQIFSGRAALVHLGAFTATIMTGNVFFIIIPNQKVVVKVLREAGTPDAKYGFMAKQRSLHNNYLTLPVIFLMLSVHYPLAFATDYNWAIAALVFLMGVTIRHFFNVTHAGKARPYWTWAITAGLFAAIIWLSSLGSPLPRAAEASALQHRLIQSARFEGVREIIETRCVMCHARAPAWDGMRIAPKGVVLERPEEIARHARDIYLQVARSRAMPPGNLSFLEEDERRKIAAWFETAQ